MNISDVAAGSRIQQAQLWRAYLWRRSGRRAVKKTARVSPVWNQSDRAKLDQGFFVGAADPAARRLEWRAMTILKWALIFFVVSIVAGILGFTGVSAASADVARFLFYVFIVIFLVLLILGLTIFRV
jgi:uncharacterized membrane protein YtjA (UPF0391 family)